jgi:hypothetical protein
MLNQLHKEFMRAARGSSWILALSFDSRGYTSKTDGSIYGLNPDAVYADGQSKVRSIYPRDQKAKP